MAQSSYQRPSQSQNNHEFLRGATTKLPVMRGVLSFGLLLGAQAVQIKVMRWSIEPDDWA